MEVDEYCDITPEVSTCEEPIPTEPTELENVDTQINQFPAFFTCKTLLELSHCSWSRSARANQNVQPYLRGCKWSPDGTCCLSVVNNDGMHVSELPRELYDKGVRSDRLIDILDSVIHVKEAGLIYDFCWYPFMNSTLPETCCWLTTRQNGPIQMWDAFNGSLRSTYRGYDKVDELEPALSITFSADGTRIIAGYKKSLKTFDVNRPGRDYTAHDITYSASCLAVNSNLLAVGSWNSTVSLYNVSETGTYKSIGKMHGHGGGVTHIKFTPDGLKLVTGARKDHRLLIWDIRYYRRPLNVLSRPNSTNQRIYFDISPCGKYLVSGGTDGIVKVWDSDQIDWRNSLDCTDLKDNATYNFPLHKDCCNSVSIHPYRPIIASGSGQLHLQDPTYEDILIKQELTADPTYKIPIKQEITNSSLNISSYDTVDNLGLSKKLDMKYSMHTENSLVFWWVGDVDDLM